MSGVLLAPGPVSVLQSVQGLSGVFHNAVTKQKFMTAAGKLQASNLGSLVILEGISRQCHVFVKRMPHEVPEIIENEGLCTPGEYEQQFMSPPSKAISVKMKEHLVRMGLVLPNLLPIDAGEAVKSEPS